jgi:hypothetical protein
MSERELFHLRSIRGPRNAAGFPQGCFSDTGFTNIVSEVGRKIMSIEDYAAWNADFEDFGNRYISAEWTITKIGTGAGALAAGDGGLLVVTNSGASGDATTHTRTVGAFQLDTTKPFYFSGRIKVDSAANADIVFGMQKITGTPFTDPTEEMVFKKAASANLDFKFGNASTYTTLAAMHTMVDNTFVTLDCGYDGSQVHIGKNGVLVASLSAANLPVASAMTPVFSVRNNTAAARALTVDWIFAGRGR